MYLTLRIRANLNKYNVVITSYEVLRNDIENFKQTPFNYCILDEGHVIRNPKTKLTQSVKTIIAKHRLILSGTPIQVHNNT
jgi:TATA-binding protein-associated factor